MPCVGGGGATSGGCSVVVLALVITLPAVEVATTDDDGSKALPLFSLVPVVAELILVCFSPWVGTASVETDRTTSDSCDDQRTVCRHGTSCCCKTLSKLTGPLRVVEYVWTPTYVGRALNRSTRNPFFPIPSTQPMVVASNQSVTVNQLRRVVGCPLSTLHTLVTC